MGTAATTPARPPAPTTPGNIGTPGQPLPPITAIEPTLEARTLQRMAEEQGEDAEIAEYGSAGKNKTHQQSNVPTMAIPPGGVGYDVVMVEGSAQVQPIHPVSKYVDPHNYKILGS